MKALLNRITRHKRYMAALALPALFAAVQIPLALKVDSPGLKKAAGTGDTRVLNKIVAEASNPTIQIAKALEPKTPLEMPALEMPLFDRAQELLYSYRGGNTRCDTRPFRDIIAEHEIKLVSDEDELENVRLAAEAVDGTVLSSGQTFSFNDIVGHRTEEKGYRAGLMYSQGQVISGIGGGICIVSTGLYDVALHSGLKILERSPHSGRVRYAEPGFDAAIAYGSSDLKFKNDTKSPVLIQTIVDDDLLKVRFFGKKQDGLEIALATEGYKEIPYKIFEKQDETVPEGEVKVKVPARTGYEVTTLRVFKQDGKIVKSEVINHSVVAPRNKVVLVPLQPENQEQILTQDGKPVQTTTEPAAVAPEQPKEAVPSGSGGSGDDSQPSVKINSEPKAIKDKNGKGVTYEIPQGWP